MIKEVRRTKKEKGKALFFIPIIPGISAVSFLCTLYPYLYSTAFLQGMYHILPM